MSFFCFKTMIKDHFKIFNSLLGVQPHIMNFLFLVSCLTWLAFIECAAEVSFKGFLVSIQCGIFFF